MYAKCTKCKLDWNVSIFSDLSKPYLCPVCRRKEAIIREKRKGVVSKTLLKNKSKFMRGGIE